MSARLPIQFEWQGPNPTAYPDRVLVPISTPGVDGGTGPQGLPGQDGADGQDGAPGASGPNQISDVTALGSLTDAVADALFVLASNATGDAARKVVLNALARAFIGTGVVSGALIVRQALGTPGTDEGESVHTGSRYQVTSKDGPVVLRGSGPTAFEVRRASDDVILLGSDNTGEFTCGALVGCSKAKAQNGLFFFAHRGVSDSGTIASVPRTPATITANQNNYAPGLAMYYRLSSDASRDITGLSVSQDNGMQCEIWNVGSNNIVLKHQDANSTAANRFICTSAADITLAADEVALLRYDSTASRWRVRKV